MTPEQNEEMNSVGDIGKALERYLRALAEAIAELEAENARLKAEQAAPKKDASDSKIRGEL